MKIINTVDGLVQLSSIPNSKPTKYQELLKVVVFIQVLVGTVMSDNMVGFFNALYLTVWKKGGDQVDVNAQKR